MKQITKYTLLTLLLLSITSITKAQDVDEIITLHLQAHGELTKWDQIESMKITGRFTAFSVEDDFYAIKTKDGKYYSELKLGQFDVIEAFNGETGWTIDPWQEFTFPRKLNKSEQNVFLQKAEFFTPFYNYKENGCEVELIGKQVVDGIDVYVINLVRPDGNTETWYLDADTYLEYKRESLWVDFAYGVPAETYFDDFREIDGLIIPFLTEKTFWQRDRVLQIEDIEFNVDVDENLFVMPRSAEIEKLAFLIGDWGVRVNAWSGRANRWYSTDSTSSTIDFIATNLIQEKISFIDFFVQSNINNFGCNSSESKYFSTTYSGFSSEIMMLDGVFTDSTFVLKNVKIGCDTSQASIQIKATYSNITLDSFTLEIEQSADNGKSWNPGLQLIYGRLKE
ncbi:MAG: hypothetical protein HQ521_19345 [Bacteroidetes bacterium]|nr:hypothetical protein [Bacteroidota bacterium]